MKSQGQRGAGIAGRRVTTVTILSALWGELDHHLSSFLVKNASKPTWVKLASENHDFRGIIWDNPLVTGGFYFGQFD